MRLLFDENLSPKLPSLLVEEFSDSVHVREVGLVGAEDSAIWEFAKTGGFTIVSKDTDFRERSFVDGFPPKVIWLDAGNSGTAAIAQLVRNEWSRITTFGGDPESSLLVLAIASENA